MRLAILIFDVCFGLVVLALPTICLIRFSRAIFSSKARQAIRQKWLFHSTLLTTSVASVLLLLFILSASTHAINAAKRARTANEANQILTAILQYETEYGEPPASNKNTRLTKILMSDNPRGIAFLSVMPKDMNTQGEMVDAWGQPYRISLADPQRSKVYSTSPEFYDGTTR
jgi:type II secretory pathway pseudopilin PulG